MRAREQGKEDKPMTLREVQSAYDADQEVTEEQVREALNIKAEDVMNTTVPTPTQADNDGFVTGEIGLDDKEENEVPTMPSLDLQQELLDQAVPSEPEPPIDGGTPVTSPPVNRDVPYVGGAGTVGSTLTCTMGNWDNEPSSYSYEWHTDGVPNSAVGDTYNVAAGDVGKEISCVVTATNALGSTAAPVSNAVSISAATREMTASGNDQGYQTRTVPKR